MLGFGGSSTLGIGLVIQLRDEFSAKANDINKSLTDLHGNANRALSNSFGMMQKTGAVMAAAGYGVYRGVKAAVNESMEFEKTMINVKALGRLSAEELQTLSNTALEMGPRFGMSANEVGVGMEELVKAGLKAKEIPKVMQSLMLTAVGAGEALGGEQGVAARMMDIMMAWGMTAEQSGRAGDILAMASVESTVNFNDLAESMKYAQNTLTGLHMTFEESVAMMAVLGNSGIKASMAGTALQNAWKELTVTLGGGSKKKNAALESLGLSPRDLMDASGNMLRPIEVLDKLKTGLQGFGDIDRQNILFDLFGQRGGRGANPLINFLSKGPKDKWMGKSFTDMVAALNNESAGRNMEIFNEKTKTAAFQAAKLSAEWDNFKIAVGNTIMPMLQSMLPMIQDLVTGLTNFVKHHPTLTKMGLIFGMMLIPIGGIIALLGTLGFAMIGLKAASAGFDTAAGWVWNSLIAKAMEYLAVLRGVGAQQKVNSVGSIYNAAGTPAGGQIVTPASKTKWGAAQLGLGGMAVGLGTELLTDTGSMANILGRTGAGALTGASIASLIPIPILSQVAGAVVGGSIGLISAIMDRQDIKQAEIQQTYTNPDLTDTYPQQSAYQNPYDLRGKQNNNFRLNLYLDGERKFSKDYNDLTENELTTKFGLNQ